MRVSTAFLKNHSRTSQLEQALGVVSDAFHVVDDGDQSQTGRKILLGIQRKVLEDHAPNQTLTGVNIAIAASQIHLRWLPTDQ